MACLFFSGSHGVAGDDPSPEGNRSINQTSPFDIVINEIMVRPAPSAGLPEVEYIELYNRSGHPVNLQNWTITLGTGSRIIPGEKVMDPGDFLLITSEKNSHQLEVFGDVAGIASFPALPAGGQTLVLRDATANVISAIKYSDKWYRNDFKTSGGWSLEQIDPFNPVAEQQTGELQRTRAEELPAGKIQSEATIPTARSRGQSGHRFFRKAA
jgi:hypothetical protein